MMLWKSDSKTRSAKDILDFASYFVKNLFGSELNKRSKETVLIVYNFEISNDNIFQVIEPLQLCVPCRRQTDDSFLVCPENKL